MGTYESPRELGDELVPSIVMSDEGVVDLSGIDGPIGFVQMAFKRLHHLVYVVRVVRVGDMGAVARWVAVSVHG